MMMMAWLQPGEVVISNAWMMKQWVDEVTALYLRSADMEADEFEVLLDVALTGKRPDHPELPAYPSSIYEGLVTTWYDM